MRLSDLVVTDARVVDPETGLDAVCAVGITGGLITSVGTEIPPARTRIDGHGLVLAPGFIDLHSHAQTVTGLSLQALDGVTTALDLEAGAFPVRAAYEAVSEEGRPINYGYSASWALVRAHVTTGFIRAPAGGTSLTGLDAAYHADWGRPADRHEVGQIVDVLDAALDEGALGIGVLLGYFPDTDPAEYRQVAALAASRGSSTFTHSRSAYPDGSPNAYDGALEVVDAAADTGAHMHLCHVNSTSDRFLDAILGVVDTAAARGVRVTTEAYPYARACTVVGAPFLAPDQLRRDGRSPTALHYVATGETIATDARLEELRRDDPGGLVVIRLFDENDPGDMARLDRALTFPGAAFASDAVPLVLPGGAPARGSWPPDSRAFAHPRSAGCFARVFAELVRDRGLLTLTEAVRRCSLLPAQILQTAAPQMARKGRVQVGCDADLVVFDPAAFRDQATYTDTTPSAGVRHLLVGGTAVVRDGELIAGALPGRPVVGRDS